MGSLSDPEKAVVIVGLAVAASLVVSMTVGIIRRRASARMLTWHIAVYFAVSVVPMYLMQGWPPALAVGILGAAGTGWLVYTARRFPDAVEGFNRKKNRT